MKGFLSFLLRKCNSHSMETFKIPILASLRIYTQVVKLSVLVRWDSSDADLEILP